MQYVAYMNMQEVIHRFGRCLVDSQNFQKRRKVIYCILVCALQQFVITIILCVRKDTLLIGFIIHECISRISCTHNWIIYFNW